MSKLSTSPDRGSFQRNGYIDRKKEAGEEPSEDYLELFKTFEQRKKEQEADPEWQKDNLEWDLRTTDWILEKVRNSDVYAQNLYAAICNNDFQKRDVMPILKDEFWSASWRSAGGIIADMRGKGDYIDWYCSGIRERDMPDNGYVTESTVTEEIEADLLKLGWMVIEDNRDNF